MREQQLPSSKKARLTPEQEAILKERLKGRLVETSEIEFKDQFAKDLPKILPDLEHRHEYFPLNDLQQAYWIGRNNAIEIGNIACHVYQEIEVLHLEQSRFNSAWQKLLERHEMLRTIILSDGQQQILDKVPKYEIEVLDLRGQDPGVVASQLEAVRDRMSHQVMNLEQWPLFEIRASLLDNQLTRLHISIDSIIADGSSLRIIIQELAQLYQNPEASLLSLELSFKDYLLAEIALKETEIYKRSLEYWQSRLSQLSPAPQLPLAKSPSSVTQPRFVRRQGKLEPATWARLKAQATKNGLTPSGVLLAVYAEVLALWTNSSQFTINVPYLNRLPLHPQVNNIVGPFPSFVLLEIDLSLTDLFEVRARQIQQQLWKDMTHRYVTGVRVLRELASMQKQAPKAMMPVVFTSTLGHNQAGWDLSPYTTLGNVVYSITQTPQVWLDFQVSEIAGTLHFDLDAVEKLFPGGLLDNMFDALSRQLECLANEEKTWHQNWQQTAQQLMPASELQQLKVINATVAHIPQQLLQTLFTAQVSAQPHRTAVISSADTLSYEELFCRANQVAHWLRKRGNRPNELVAVVMEKGWEQVIAVLGILAAGSAYLPIDAKIPRERLLYLLDNGEVRFVLTQSWLKENLDWTESRQILCIDSEELANDSDQPLDSLQQPEDIAYVIYTSGSTGLPKGVMITHQAAVNAIICTNKYFNVSCEDRVLALTALNHDMSVYDIFGILAAGGTIVIPEASEALNPVKWAQLIRDEKITIWNSVPAMLDIFLEYIDGCSDPWSSSLRLAFLGGDWISLTLPDRLQALVEGVQIVSVGGPTETTLWNIWYPITSVDPTWKSIPYGRPIANTRYYVLNEVLEHCPVWVTGELYCAGIGLAKGYWNDQQKTLEKFINHPRTGERLYRTGDLGRYLPDGNIEFLGRVDFQLKIRGYRIEPKEVEAALTQHPAIEAAVVTAVGEQHSKRLVAYIVPSQQLISTNQQGTPGQNLAEAIDPTQLQGVLVNPVERIEFKLKHIALKQPEPGQTCIQLLKPELDESISELYLKRQSYRQFLAEPISFEQVSQLLNTLLQIKLDSIPLPKYRYPSGGGLYSVQTYLYIKPNQVEGLEGGVYYYHNANHHLMFINPASNISDIYPAINQPIFEQSAFAIFLIGEMKAKAPMYGESAKDLCLLEAGYMGQLLMDNAPDCEIGLCPIGFLDIEHLRDLFRLEESQVLLHSFLGGKIDLFQKKQWLEMKTSQGSRSITTQLRDYLQEKLPEHMIPSAYKVLETLPLNANGKIDRNSLPVFDTSSLKNKVFVAPRNNTEELVANIYKEVLGLEKIGIHDNFFELGGHSLLAMQVISKLSLAMNCEVSIKHLFTQPTVAELATVLESLPKNTTHAMPNQMEAKPVIDATNYIYPQKSINLKVSPYLKLENRSLLSLFAMGDIPSIDAAALMYLPGNILEKTGLSKKEVIYDWYDNVPVLNTIMETHLGRIGVLLLPRFSFELYSSQEELVRISLSALKIAKLIGARTVSLTGLIPSATDYGNAIANAIGTQNDLPKITTGHATTSATVILAIQKILQEGRRDITQERVGFLGLGSVGLSSLRLMLKCLPHPKEIILCDVYSKLEYLKKIRQELANDLGFQKNVHIIISQAELPREIYEATLIVGATNAAEILDINRLKPGTMIVDDSVPHCFKTNIAIQRFQEQQDILFTEGGIIRSDHPIYETTYFPHEIEKTAMNSPQVAAALEIFFQHNPYNITGCIFSSLLSSCFEELKPTLGSVDVNTSLQHYEVLTKLGFEAADLHCEDYVLPKESIQKYAYRFGMN
ncbi:MAG: amino acid adenylation domain-containing protein [Dolichospermum sp. DEX182a]|nr:amino acid adenylation domain-containing protein [Dolichospermum sp. DEX182a]